MFRHDNISHNHEPVALARLFQNREEAVATAWRAQKRQPAVARTGDKVQMMSPVGAMQAARHDKLNGTGSIPTRPCKNRKDGAPTVPERDGTTQNNKDGPPATVRPQRKSSLCSAASWPAGTGSACKPSQADLAQCADPARRACGASALAAGLQQQQQQRWWRHSRRGNTERKLYRNRNRSHVGDDRCPVAHCTNHSNRSVIALTSCAPRKRGAHFLLIVQATSPVPFQRTANTAVTLTYWRL